MQPFGVVKSFDIIKDDGFGFFHMSIGYMKPNQLHENNQLTEKLWRTYYTKNRTIVNQPQD